MTRARGRATSAAGPRGLLPVLFAGVFMGALDIAIMAPALPALDDAFQPGARWLPWIISLYALGYLVGAPLLGKLSDRLGRRGVYLACLAIFAAGAAVGAVAPTFAVLLAGRAIQGFGAGGIFPVAAAVVGDAYPAARRGRTLGIIGAVFGLAYVVGPPLGGILLKVGTWRWLFGLNLPLAAGVAWAAWRRLPAAAPNRPRPIDGLGMVLLASVLACFALGVTLVDATQVLASLASAGVWPWWLAAALLLPWLRAVERRAADPVVPLDLLARRRMAAACAIAAGVGMIETGIAFLPALAVRSFGVSYPTASFMMVPLVLTLMVGAPVAGRLVDASGPKPVIMAGAALLTAGLLGFGFASGTLPGFYAAGGAVGLGIASLAGSPLRFVVLEEGGADRRAAAQGAQAVAMEIGLIVGPGVLGAIMAGMADPVVGYRTAFVAMAVLAGGLAGLATLL